MLVNSRLFCGIFKFSQATAHTYICMYVQWAAIWINAHLVVWLPTYYYVRWKCGWELGTWARCGQKGKCESPFNLRVIRKRNDYKLSSIVDRIDGSRPGRLIDFPGKERLLPGRLECAQSGAECEQRRSAAENRHKLHDAFGVRRDGEAVETHVQKCS